MQEREDRIYQQIIDKLENYPRIVYEYCDYLIKGEKSIRTTRTYINTVIQFLDTTYSDRIPHEFWKTITEIEIQQFLDSLRSNKSYDIIGSASAAAKATCWSALYSFFEFLIPQHLSFNPVNRIKRPQIPKHQAMIYLTLDEVDLLYKNISRTTNKNLQCRDRCILMLGLECALRASEVVNLDIDDINWRNSEIQITSDDGNCRVMKIHDNVKEELRHWLRCREKNYDAPTRALFVSQEMKRLSQRSLKDILDKYSVGIEKQVTFQVLRSTCVVTLYNKTNDIGLCAKYLQCTIEAAQRYLYQISAETNIHVNDAGKIINDAYNGENCSDYIENLTDRQKCLILRNVWKEILILNDIEYNEEPCTSITCRFEDCEKYKEDILLIQGAIRKYIIENQTISISRVNLNGSRIQPSDSFRKLALDKKTCGALEFIGINTVGDIIGLAEEQIFELEWITDRQAIEIVERVHSCGLEFAKVRALNVPFRIPQFDEDYFEWTDGDD